MLQQLFGSKEDKPKDLKKLPMAQRFKMFVSEHNAIIRAKQREKRKPRKQPAKPKS